MPTESIYTGAPLTPENRADAKNPYTKEDLKGRNWAKRSTQHSLHLLEFLIRVAIRRGRGREVLAYVEHFVRREEQRQGRDVAARCTAGELMPALERLRQAQADWTRWASLIEERLRAEERHVDAPLSQAQSQLLD